MNLSEETKAKISAAHKGKHRHFTKEWVANIVAARKGYRHSAETKAKIGASNVGKHDMRGENNPMFGKRGENNPNHGRLHTIEARTKMSAKCRDMTGKNNPFFGKKHTRETIAKQSASKMGEKNSNFGKSYPEEAKAKRAITLKNRPESVERIRQGTSANLKKLRKDPEFNKKMFKAHRKRPTKPEQQIETILNSNWPKKWKYVGDGEVILGGLNPDFINVDGKKLIIEVFGDYYHSPEILGDDWKRGELGRIMTFSQFGYKTLIVWENELKDKDQVISKIEQFSLERKIVVHRHAREVE